MRSRTRLVTVFGLGHLRPASGTWGSTPPPALALLLTWALGANGLSPADHLLINASLVAVGLFFAVACVAGGTAAEARFGRKDPSQVVADEVAGQAIALLALPWRSMTETGTNLPSALYWNVALAGTAFLTFRLFDIVKPPPAHALQRLPGGWGILVDDLFAGAYALVATHLLVRYAWTPLLGG